METDSPNSQSDFCQYVLNKFNNPTNERHLHICSTIGTIYQELKDQKLPLTPLSYFGATCSSLDRLLDSRQTANDDIIDALFTLVNLVIHRINFPAVLDKKYEFLESLVWRTVAGCNGGVKVLEGVVKLCLVLLTVRHKVAWSDVSRVFEVVVGFVTDERPQVRKQSNMCLSQVLRTFGSVLNLTPLLTPSSESLTAVFERSFLLASESLKVNDSEGPKGAQKVLYVLDTFKACLPFMSSKSLNKILKHFKTLLDVRQSFVTRRITDAIDKLCRHNREDVNGEALVELLCSLAAMISPRESSADNMTFTARLLGNGMKQVYSLDRQICVVKLPVVVSALTNVLTSGHQGALVEVVNTYKNLIRTCVDQSLIEQGVDQIRINAHATKKSGPTVIEKLCATTESLLDYQYEFSDDFTSRKLENVLHLMIEVLPSNHFSAKRHRLDCLYFLIVHVSKEGYEQRRQEITVSFLTEIILALKEANMKTRNRAYEILVKVGHAYGDEDDNGSEKGKLQQLFNMVAGGLAGETPHMISAAITGLARLAYEFSDLISFVYDILPSTFLLLQRKNKEIIKANLGLLKVLVAKSEVGGLQKHLRNMVECLLNWQDSNRNQFKAKVKQLLEMLVKKCGLESVKAVMPEEHMKLLTNIRKLKERKEKNQAAGSVESRSVMSKATTSRSKRKRSEGKSLQEDLFEQSNDNPLDLLDVQRTRSALRSSALTRNKTDSDEEPEIDSEGRLVIHEDGKRKIENQAEERCRF